MKNTQQPERGRDRGLVWAAGILGFLLGPGCAAASAAAAPHTVAPRECLWDLSQRYYGDPFRWRDIAGANPQVKDPHWIYPGQVLSIPQAGSAPQPKVELEAPAPVETGAAVAAVAPVEVAAPVAAAAPVQSAPALAARISEDLPAAEEVAPRAEGLANRDSLSTRFPEGHAGQYPSVSRFKAPAGWKEDGRITEFDGAEVIAGPGDLAEARMDDKAPVRVGDRLYVLRADSPTEADGDQDASYLQRVGVVQAESLLPEGRVRLRVLKSGGAVEVGDLLSRKGL